MTLAPCSDCRGLLPSHATSCPHCDAPAPGRSPLARAARAVVSLATGGAVAMTLMACYGMPPCEDGEEGNCISEGGGGGGGEDAATTSGSTTGTTTTGATSTGTSSAATTSSTGTAGGVGGGG